MEKSLRWWTEHYTQGMWERLHFPLEMEEFLKRERPVPQWDLQPSECSIPWRRLQILSCRTAGIQEWKRQFATGGLVGLWIKQWASLIGPSKNGPSLFLLTCSFLTQAPRDVGPDISHISQFCVKLVRGWKWLLVWRVLNSVLWPSLCTSAVWVSLRDYCTF